MRVGCHLSTSKGFVKTVERAIELNANAFQYFPKNPRSNRLRHLDAKEAEKGATAADHADLLTVAHSPYVTNLSTPDKDLHTKTVESLVNDLEICDAFHTPYLVVHCGKHVGQGEDVGRRTMVDTMDEVLDRFQGKALLLLENTAGQGSELGTTFEELMEIRAQSAQQERIAFCYDTCHAFAAGALDYDHWEKALERLQNCGALPLIKAVHFNDSMTGFLGHRDRHQLLGKGEIGLDRLRTIAQSPAFADIPLLLETPVEKEEAYADEIALLRQWIEEATA